MKKDEVKSFNGKDGQPAYVIYKGRVYDVTGNSKWKKGVHMARHSAGEDLTDFLSMAPHGEEVFTRVSEVGTVQEAEPELPSFKERVQDNYRKFHPHPIMIHFPIGISSFAAFMQFLYILTNNISFENAAFYALVCATLSVFPATLSGLISWWANYETTLTTIFKNKLVFSVILIIISISAVGLRLLIPGIAARPGLLSIVYDFLIFAQIPVSAYIAYNGGKITWPS